jgi:anti-sigma factor RsiW
MTDSRDFDMVPDMLSGYLDDELTPAERAAVEARLEESAEWRSELDDVRVARDAVRGLPAREAPDGFWARVNSVVEAADAGDAVAEDHDDDEVAAPVPITAAPGAKTRRRVNRFVAAVGVAAAAVIVAVAVLPGRSTVKPNIAAVATQHGASSVGTGEPISALTPVGPMAGFR